MNNKTQNYITMIGTCIKVSNEPEHQPVWIGKDPVDFTADMSRLTT